VKRRLCSILCLAAAIVTAAAGTSDKENVTCRTETARGLQQGFHADMVPDISRSLSDMMALAARMDNETDRYPRFSYSRDFSSEDSYLLAKIAMAEAESESLETKTFVIMTVLNRVQSDDFPDSIQEVIYQCSKGTYQFSCIGNGRWDRVEPDEECWEAVRVVQEAEYDYSGGCLYFESSIKEDNWHSRNLEYLYQCDSLRFYR